MKLEEVAPKELKVEQNQYTVTILTTKVSELVDGLELYLKTGLAFASSTMYDRNGCCCLDGSMFYSSIPEGTDREEANEILWRKWYTRTSLDAWRENEMSLFGELLYRLNDGCNTSDDRRVMAEFVLASMKGWNQDLTVEEIDTLVRTTHFQFRNNKQKMFEELNRQLQSPNNAP